MLYIDGQKVKAKDFCDKFGIDFAKLKFKPSYELDKSHMKKDRMNGGRISVPSGMMFRTKFHVSTKDGDSIEVRYAETASPKAHKTGHVETIYKPRYVGFTAATASFKKDTDLAVFMFANPSNKFSPFRNEYSPKAGYEFIDGKMRALGKIKEMEVLTDALAHAKSLKGHDLSIVAKGLKTNGSNDSEEEAVRAGVMEYASKNPKQYLDLISLGVVKTEGRIRTLVDKKVFVLRSQHNSRWWEWAKGERMGERIGNLITNPTQDSTQSLINFLKSNLDVYDDLISSLSEDIGAEESAKQYMEKHNLEPSPVKKEDVSPVGFDVDNDKDVTSFIKSKGYKAAPVAKKDLKEAVRNGEVNGDNIDFYLSQYFNKSEV